VSVLVGDRSIISSHWDAWLTCRGRTSVHVIVDEGDREGVGSHLIAGLLHDGDPGRAVAAFLARGTGEPASELEARLPALGGPERAALLERASSGSGTPALTQLCEALLEGPQAPPPAISEAELLPLVELLDGEGRLGLLLEAAALEPGFGVLRRIAERRPGLPVALMTTPEALAPATGSGTPGDRGRARVMLREGLLRLDTSDEPATAASPSIEALREQLASLHEAAKTDPVAADRARSLAERLLYEALEAHPSTHGRFELNPRMPFTFGNRAAEIDLYSRRDRLAVEVDGYYHFVDDDAYRRDRRKDALMQRHGMFVLRFLAQDVGPRLTEIVERIVDTLHRPPPETFT